MAEVAFRPARQFSEYKGKGASASRELFIMPAAKRSLSSVAQKAVLQIIPASTYVIYSTLVREV